MEIKYLITMPIPQSRSEETGDVLFDNVISKYHITDYIITDKDSIFMSSLMNYFFNLIQKVRL